MYNILLYPYSTKSKIAALNSATITRTYVAASLRFKTKKSSSKKIDELLKKNWRRPTLPLFAVPSALEGLTSVFGMGTGEPLC